MSVKHPVAWLPTDDWQPAEGVTGQQVRQHLIDLLNAAATECGRCGILVRSRMAIGERVAGEIVADIATEAGRAAVAEKLADYTVLPVKRVLGLKLGTNQDPRMPTVGGVIGWVLVDDLKTVAGTNVVELFYE